MLYTEVLEALDTDEHLEHFGIKGMRWGQRRQADVNTATGSTDKPYSKKFSLKNVSTRTKVEAGAGVAAALLIGVGARKIHGLKLNNAALIKDLENSKIPGMRVDGFRIHV